MEQRNSAFLCYNFELILSVRYIDDTLANNYEPI